MSDSGERYVQYCEKVMQTKFAEFRRHFGDISAIFRTSIVQVAAKFRKLGEKVRRHFAVLNEISPRTFVSARRKFASYKRNSFRLNEISFLLSESSWD